MASMPDGVFQVRLASMRGKGQPTPINGIPPVSVTYEQLSTENGVRSACERNWSQMFLDLASRLQNDSNIVVVFTNHKGTRSIKFPGIKSSIKTQIDEAIRSSKANTDGVCNPCFERDCPGKDHSVSVYYCFESRALSALCDQQKHDLQFDKDDSTFSIKFFTGEDDPVASSTDALEQLSLLPSCLLGKEH